MLQSLPFVPNVFPAVLGYGIETLYRVQVADNVTERPVARTFSAADGEPPVPNTCTPLMPNRGVPDAGLAAQTLHLFDRLLDKIICCRASIAGENIVQRCRRAFVADPGSVRIRQVTDAKADAV